MKSSMTEIYLWLKTLHILSVIAWAGGMLILPYIYILLVKQPENKDLYLNLARLLIRRMINGAMIFAYITGGGLFWVLMQNGGMTHSWLHNKITIALLLSGCHGFLSGGLRRMRNKGAAPKSLRYYQTFAAVITLSIVAIVILAVQKPM